MVRSVTAPDPDPVFYLFETSPGKGTRNAVHSPYTVLPVF